MLSQETLFVCFESPSCSLRSRALLLRAHWTHTSASISAASVSSLASTSISRKTFWPKSCELAWHVYESWLIHAYSACLLCVLQGFVLFERCFLRSSWFSRMPGCTLRRCRNSKTCLLSFSRLKSISSFDRLADWFHWIVLEPPKMAETEQHSSVLWLSFFSVLVEATEVTLRPLDLWVWVYQSLHVRLKANSTITSKLPHKLVDIHQISQCPHV